MKPKIYNQIIKWCLHGKSKNRCKKKEKTWAAKILDNKTKNWSALLGEKIVFEVLKKLGKKPKKPVKKLCYVPDIETEDCIYEVKTRNWNTSGTAGEKVFGTPLKYAEIPRLYGKPLKIVCVAFQEHEMEHGKTPIFGEKVRENHKKFIDFYKANNIEFIKFSELLSELSSSEGTQSSSDSSQDVF